MGTLTKDRVPVMTHDEKDKFLPDHRHKTPDDIVGRGKSGEEKIAMTSGGLKEGGCGKMFATELIHQRRARRGVEEQHAEMTEMYTSARDIIEEIEDYIYTHTCAYSYRQRKVRIALK